MNQGVGTAVVAFVTTLHLALLLLRHHRSVRGLRGAPLLLPSALLTAAPWALGSPPWLAAGLLAHVLWFLACERLAPPVQTADTGRTASREPAPRAQRPAGAERSVSFLQAPVLAVVDETPDIRTFRFLRPEGLSFLPGQFLNVRVNVDGKPLVRCYSISSAPESTGYLEISVKRQGTVSSLLHSTVRPGSVVSIKGPAGRFTYPQGDDRPLILIGGGVGVTPLMSMLRHAVASDPSRPVRLLLSVRTEKDVPYRDELLSIGHRHRQTAICVRMSRGSATAGTSVGRIDEACLRRYVTDAANSLFMICGPLPMIDAMRGLALKLGARAENVRSEAFEAAVAASAAGEHLAPVVPIASGGRSVKLTLALSQQTIPVARSQSLLDACEAAGVDMPSSCRAGVCLSCRTRLLEGEVDCSSDSLDAEDRASGFVLPCVSWPKSDCVLEA